MVLRSQICFDLSMAELQRSLRFFSFLREPIRKLNEVPHFGLLIFISSQFLNSNTILWHNSTVFISTAKFYEVLFLTVVVDLKHLIQQFDF